MLHWLLNYSPYHVAIWTGSQKATAVRCLDELDLGIVGPKLGTSSPPLFLLTSHTSPCSEELVWNVSDRWLTTITRSVGPKRDQAELLHPKLVAVWAREDIGLTPEDFNSYVAIVKDFDKLVSWVKTTGMRAELTASSLAVGLPRKSSQHRRPRVSHIDLSLLQKRKGIGDWSPYNTVMVDDTTLKLRAQPSTLIAAPTFDYPLEPGLQALRAMLDTFLLQLVGMLDELAPQSNFAKFIETEKWNEKMTSRSAEFTSAGIRILKQCKIPIDAEGRSHIPLSAAEDKQARLARLARAQLTVPSEIYVRTIQRAR